MNHQIHKSLTDEAGTTYRVISQRWLHAMTALMVLLLFTVLSLLVLLLEETRTFDSWQETTKQRRAAMDEMLSKRAKVQEWTYIKACEYAKSKGEKCLDDPQWWANPQHYPLLHSNEDGAGSGLFPREE